MTVDFNTDLWWSTEFGQGDKRTLAEWQATSIGVIPSNFFVIGYGDTSGSFQATTAFADMIHIVTTASDDTWDFEGVVTLPPPAVADVSMVKTLDTVAPFAAGDTIEYTLAVFNHGPNAATNIQVEDEPTNLTITSVASASCTALPCTIPTLASGASEVITMMASIDADGTFDNVAGALAVEEDPDLTNNVDDTGNGGSTLPPPVPTFVTVDPADQQGWFAKSSNTGTGGLTTNKPWGTGGTGSLELNIGGMVRQVL